MSARMGSGSSIVWNRFGRSSRRAQTLARGGTGGWWLRRGCGLGLWLRGSSRSGRSGPESRPTARRSGMPLSMWAGALCSVCVARWHRTLSTALPLSRVACAVAGRACCSARRSIPWLVLVGRTRGPGTFSSCCLGALFVSIGWSSTCVADLAVGCVLAWVRSRWGMYAAACRSPSRE